MHVRTAGRGCPQPSHLSDRYPASPCLCIAASALLSAWVGKLWRLCNLHTVWHGRVSDPDTSLQARKLRAQTALLPAHSSKLWS